MTHNLIFVYYFCKFSTHRKVLDRQCQEPESSLAAGREREEWLHALEPRPARARISSCESKIQSQGGAPFILCSRILVGPSIEHDKWHHHWMKSTPSLPNGHLVFL